MNSLLPLSSNLVKTALVLTVALPASLLAQTYSKVETTEYHDDTVLWALGQVKRTTTSGFETSKTEFGWKALPWKTYGFGKLQQTLTYDTISTVASGQLGTLKTVADGNNNVTTLTSWKRGIPQAIQYPATSESPSGATQSAVVNDDGWIASVTDENGYITSYTYDAMGRLASIAYPAGDVPASNPVTFSFQQVNAADRGLPAGHWMHVRMQGNRHTHTYYDGLWRPVMTLDYDITDPTYNTQTQTIQRYDSSGRLAFQSYPNRHVADFNQSLPGVWTVYDALDRQISVSQDSELGPLTTTSEYLSGFMTRVTNPRGYKTLTRYAVYDQPAYDWPVTINQADSTADNASTDIVRDVFGKPTAMRRRNADGSLGVWRNYVYAWDQSLCKAIEPESGASVFYNDGANNLLWSASGLNLPSLTDCSFSEAQSSGRVVTRAYDNRSRLTGLQFPDGRGNQSWAYMPDGLPASITTNNANGGDTVINSYNYNKRRLLTGESISQPGWYTWGIGYGYDANGSLATQTYPTNFSVSFAPNALGQPTQAGPYATGVQYYPNGGIKQFTYGNGVVHTMLQNARQLPDRSTDGAALDLEYHYDVNGNVEFIGDWVPGQSHRWMTYDGLDRLSSVGSAMFGGDHWHRFTYDALDNLKSWKLGGVKDNAEYVYDSKNQLTNIKNSAGASIVGLSYDVQGNLSNKNGQGYQFDYGNRLREVTGKEWFYRYDGYGRRVLSGRADGITVSQYSQSGQLMYAEQTGKGNFEHIYLRGSLVATRNNGVAKYQHTDALGSPVAVTDAAGAVIDRTNYEPYGAAINKPAYDGIGYTGQVMDAATGLTYMQQRYYDPAIGRFLSVDPVTANSGTGANFNRYWYANNNPYKFTDPDGRQSKPSDDLDDVYETVLSGIDASVTPPTMSPEERLVSGVFGGMDLVYGAASVGGDAFGVTVSVASPADGPLLDAAFALKAAKDSMQTVDGFRGLLSAFDGRARPNTFEQTGGYFGGEKGAFVGTVVSMGLTFQGGAKALKSIFSEGDRTIRNLGNALKPYIDSAKDPMEDQLLDQLEKR